MQLRVTPSALKHGCTAEDISHALDMNQHEEIINVHTVPPKRLFIGPTTAGNLLEMVGGEIDQGQTLLVWHAMPCRHKYLDRLTTGGRRL